jgi:hypothetical protein
MPSMRIGDAVHPEIERFVAAMRADSRLSALADTFAAGFEALQREGDENGHAIEAFDAFRWIVRQPRTIDEKLDALQKLTSLQGKVNIPCLRKFLGW